MSTLPLSRLRGKGVYVITDGPRDDLFAAVEAALAGGARLLQYRDTTRDTERRRAEADEIARLCAHHGVPFIVDADLELARQVSAGLHVGRDDVSIPEARAILGADAIIGGACYGSWERAQQLAGEGADYLSFGAMYPSRTLPDATVVPHDLLTQVATLGVPVVAIGGINADNAQVLIDAGADYVAVISAVFAARDIQTATRRLADLFESQPGILR
jgi:thiamine-phosphate pyrophosphorylase